MIFVFKIFGLQKLLEQKDIEAVGLMNSCDISTYIQYFSDSIISNYQSFIKYGFYQILFIKKIAIILERLKPEYRQYRNLEAFKKQHILIDNCLCDIIRYFSMCENLNFTKQFLMDNFPKSQPSQIFELLHDIKKLVPNESIAKSNTEYLEELKQKDSEKANKLGSKIQEFKELFYALSNMPIAQD